MLAIVQRFCHIKVLFHFVLLLLDERKSFIIPRTLLYGGSLDEVPLTV